MGDRREPTPVDPDATRPPAPSAPPKTRGGYQPDGGELRDPPKGGSGVPRIEVGDDGRARLEKDMGLKIDPETGHAYEDQGTFQNLGLNAGGTFYNGRAVPRMAKCAECGTMVVESAWGQGFQNCGAIDLGEGGVFFLGPCCVARVLRTVPNIRGQVAAMNGGKLKP